MCSFAATATIQFQNIFNTPRRNPGTLCCQVPACLHTPPFPYTKQRLIYFPSLQICLFWAFNHINGIIQYVVFCDWLLSLNMFSRFSILWHVSVLPSFLQLENIPLYLSIYLTFCLCIHQLMSNWVVSTFLCILHNDAMNIVCTFLCGQMFSALLRIHLRVELSYSNFTFNILRN